MGYAGFKGIVNGFGEGHLASTGSMLGCKSTMWGLNRLCGVRIAYVEFE